MKKEIVFLYSGQGSQYFGMCKNYYEEDEVFHQWMDYLDKIAIEESGLSVLQYIYSGEGVSKRCDDISYTHMAICMIEYAMTKSLEHKGIHFDRVVGSSLGEYVCMAVTGMISLRDLFRMLVRQANLLKEKCPTGKMMAILDDYDNYKWDILDVDVAAVNYKKHFIISGNPDAIEQMKRRFQGLKIDVFDIPVNYAFHSSQIDTIKSECMSIFDDLKVIESKVPILSSSQEKEMFSYNTQELWEIIRKPIMFRQIVSNEFSNENSILIDVGPSSTLAGFCRNILQRRNDIYGIISPFHGESGLVKKLQAEIQKNGAYDD